MSDLPLHNRNIVVTRDAGDAETLIGALHRLGARAIPFAAIRIEATDDWKACDEALIDLDRYTWIVFSSRNSVRFFLHRMQEKSIALSRQKIGALGRKTASELQLHGIDADLVPDIYTAEGFIRHAAKKIRAGESVLLPVSDIARPDLPDGLRSLGAHADTVVVYRTLPARGEDVAVLRKMLQNKTVDCLTFFSPSAFTNFIEIFGRDMRERTGGSPPVIAAIGPTTAGAVRAVGMTPDIVPENSTEEHMVGAIAEYYVKQT